MTTRACRSLFKFTVTSVPKSAMKASHLRFGSVDILSLLLLDRRELQRCGVLQMRPHQVRDLHVGIIDDPLGAVPVQEA